MTANPKRIKDDVWQWHVQLATVEQARKARPARHDSPCTTCGTDPKDDLHPRVGALCYWCEELRLIGQERKQAEQAATIERIRAKVTVTRGTLSTGPRRAPAIPSVRIRQHHRTWADWTFYTIFWCYLAFIIIVVGIMQGGQ